MTTLRTGDILLDAPGRYSSTAEEVAAWIQGLRELRAQYESTSLGGRRLSGAISDAENLLADLQREPPSP